MEIGKTPETKRNQSSFDPSFQDGKKESMQSSRPQRAENSQPADRATVSVSHVFGEGSSNLARSLTSGNPASGMASLHVPADLREAMSELVAGDGGLSLHAEGQAPSDVSAENVHRDGEADRAELGQLGPNSDSSSVVVAHDEGRAPQDAVTTTSARAASTLAAMVEQVPFGAVALGAVSNMADFLAPAVVDGIGNPLARSAVAAGFSGVFLGLTASVTSALGKDIGQQITESRITSKAPEGEVSRGSQLLSAVKNQTIPAFIGFGAAFTLASALDAGTGKLGNTALNAETVLLKMARATAGAVGVGLAQEFSKTMSSDHTLTRTETNRVFDNIRSLGEAIKKNVTSLPQAISAYTRPTERGAGTEFGNVLGAAFGFATFAAIYGVVHGALQNEYGEKTGERLSEPDAQAAIATAAGVAGFVIADQLTRNIYANLMPARGAPVAEAAQIDLPRFEVPTRVTI
jgi:hypothetical protein